MPSTFKLNIIRYRFMTFAIKNMFCSKKKLFCLICLVSIVFLGEFVENDGVLAQEKQTLKCPELSNPNSPEELKELRDCLQKIKFEIQRGSKIQKFKDHMMVPWSYLNSLIWSWTIKLPNKLPKIH